jgi:hypothetical protein
MRKGQSGRDLATLQSQSCVIRCSMCSPLVATQLDTTRINKTKQNKEKYKREGKKENESERKREMIRLKDMDSMRAATSKMDEINGN